MQINTAEFTTEAIEDYHEGLLMMSIGSRYRFFISHELAWGKRYAGKKIGPFAIRIIDTRLVDENNYDRDKAAEQSEVPVFILNTESGQINKKKIIVGGLRGNELEVFDGLEPGDLVVTAGVTFCRDGMKAKIWNPMK